MKRFHELSIGPKSASMLAFFLIDMGGRLRFLFSSHPFNYSASFLFEAFCCNTLVQADIYIYRYR